MASGDPMVSGLADGALKMPAELIPPKPKGGKTFSAPAAVDAG